MIGVGYLGVIHNDIEEAGDIFWRLANWTSYIIPGTSWDDVGSIHKPDGRLQRV